MANWCNVHCFLSATCSYAKQADCCFDFCHLLSLLFFAACTPLASKCTVHFFFSAMQAAAWTDWLLLWFLLFPVAMLFLLFMLPLAPQLFFLSLVWLPCTGWLCFCFLFFYYFVFDCLCNCYNCCFSATFMGHQLMQGSFLFLLLAQPCFTGWMLFLFSLPLAWWLSLLFFCHLHPPVNQCKVYYFFLSCSCATLVETESPLQQPVNLSGAFLAYIVNIATLVASRSHQVLARLPLVTAVDANKSLCSISTIAFIATTLTHCYACASRYAIKFYKI